MSKKHKRDFDFNSEYQNFFKKPNIKLIEILYLNQKKLNYSILKRDHKLIRIDNWKRRSEFMQIYYFLLISKSGYFPPVKIIQIYNNFSDYVDYLLEKDKSKKFRSVENKIVNLIKELNFLNDKISSIVYSYIFSFEKNINYLIDSKFILQNLDFLEIKFKKEGLNKKIKKILEENEKIREEKNVFLRNSKIINKLSLSEKILILKYLWYENYLNLNDDLMKRNFISKEKIEERKKYFKKKYPAILNQEIDKKIWDIFIDRLKRTNTYRNKISHLDDLIIEGNESKKLFNYFYDQYDLLRNNYTIEIFYKTKIIFLKSDLISKNEILKSHYKSFFDFKINKIKIKSKKEQYFNKNTVLMKDTNDLKFPQLNEIQ